jgi:hypothetical protein
MICERAKEEPMKVKITVDMENADGSAEVESTVIEIDVPDFEEFTGPDTFGAVFDKYERKVLKARKEVIEAATEKYLSEMQKKKRSQRSMSEGENSLSDQNPTP